MKHQRLFTMITGVSLVALGLPAITTAQQPANDPDGVEVLTSGPIHEAYAEPVSGQPQPTPIIPRKPPDPIEEVPSDQKPAGDNVQWIPGYWAWDDDRGDFLWVSGFWRVPPPDRQWVPGYWRETEGGWQWTPGFWADASQNQATYLPPPPPSVDAGPSVPAPQPDAIYVPGTWVYQQTRYLWQPGFWNVPRLGWVWVPAHFVWTPSGYIFVDGYWDYALQDRGLLFAPAYIARGLWSRPGWFYQPRYAVYPDFLLNALFIRPGAYSYYFGDYYDPRYRQLGYQSWLDYRPNRFSADPLFSYYRWNNRNSDWLTGVRQLYTARVNGTAARPPRTLAQQSTLVRNVGNRTVNVSNINHVVAVAPVTNLDRRRLTTNLQQVTPAQRQQVIQHINLHQTSRQKRGQVETQIHTQAGAPLRPGDPARTGTLHVPRVPGPAPAAPRVQSPPRPVHPQHETRPIPKYEAPRPEVRPVPRQPKAPPKAEVRPQAPRPVAPRPPAVKPAPAPHKAPPQRKPAPPAHEKKPPEKKASAANLGPRPVQTGVRAAPPIRSAPAAPRPAIHRPAAHAAAPRPAVHAPAARPAAVRTAAPHTAGQRHRS